MPGRYTREGDVAELIGKTDDRFAVARPGDELVVSFAQEEVAERVINMLLSQQG